MKTEKLANKLVSRRILTALMCGVVLASLVVLDIVALENPAGLTRSVSARVANGLRCSNATIAGRYAVRGDGFVPGGPPPAPMVPFAIVSLMSLDDSGTLTNDVTVSRNGAIFQNVDQGTFNVNEDCTGNMTIQIKEPPFTLTFDLVITDQGNEFYAIATTPSVVTFGAKRIRPRPWSRRGPAGRDSDDE